MPLDPQTIVSTMTAVQRLVYETVNFDTVDMRRIEAELFDIRRMAFNDELEIQAAAVGCSNRRGNLTNTDILNRLDIASTTDAESVANTYNYFIALEIIRIGEENPNATRAYYAERIAKWDASYWLYKDGVVALYADQSARAMAQQEFYARNRGVLDPNGVFFATAVMEPRMAVCPVCQGWIDRGGVGLLVALNNPPPYHANCFIPGSMVNMADGSSRPIEQISIGEAVASRHGTTLVNQVHRRYTQEVLYLVVVGDRALQCTGDHPLLTSQGWTSARELQVGTSVALVRFHEVLPDGTRHTELSDCEDDCSMFLPSQRYGEHPVG